MDYITTTELRTKSSKLVKTLQKGEGVSLIHRSRVIAKIEPFKIPRAPLINNIEEFRKLIENISPKKRVSRSKRGDIYRKHLESKYGQGLP